MATTQNRRREKTMKTTLGQSHDVWPGQARPGQDRVAASPVFWSGPIVWPLAVAIKCMAHGTWHSGTSAAAAAAAQMACHVFAKLGKFPYSVFVIRYSLLSPLYDVELDFAACDFNIERARRDEQCQQGAWLCKNCKLSPFIKCCWPEKELLASPSCCCFFCQPQQPQPTTTTRGRRKKKQDK